MSEREMYKVINDRMYAYYERFESHEQAYEWACKNVPENMGFFIQKFTCRVSDDSDIPAASVISDSDKIDLILKRIEEIDRKVSPDEETDDESDISGTLEGFMNWFGDLFSTEPDEETDEETDDESDISEDEPGPIELVYYFELRKNGPEYSSDDCPVVEGYRASVTATSEEEARNKLPKPKGSMWWSQYTGELEDEDIPSFWKKWVRCGNCYIPMYDRTYGCSACRETGLVEKNSPYDSSTKNKYAYRLEPTNSFASNPSPPDDYVSSYLMVVEGMDTMDAYCDLPHPSRAYDWKLFQQNLCCDPPEARKYVMHKSCMDEEYRYPLGCKECNHTGIIEDRSRKV